MGANPQKVGAVGLMGIFLNIERSDQWSVTLMTWHPSEWLCLLFSGTALSLVWSRPVFESLLYQSLGADHPASLDKGRAQDNEVLSSVMFKMSSELLRARFSSYNRAVSQTKQTYTHIHTHVHTHTHTHTHTFAIFRKQKAK